MIRIRKMTAAAAAVLLCLSFAGCFDVSIAVSGANDAALLGIVTGEQFSTRAVEENPVGAQESVTFPENTTASEYTTAAPVSYEQETDEQTTKTAAKNSRPADMTPDKMDNEALLEYFNECLNNVKIKKPGFTKSKLTSILDLQLSNSAANSVVGFVKSALLSDDTEVTKVGKGDDCTNIMSPSGATYASRMNLGDVNSVTCKKSGQNYVITANVVEQHNPVKNTGVMSDVFDFATVDDVMNVYAPKVGATLAKENVELDFSDCYAELTVSSSGKVIKYETYVKGVINMRNASIKKVVTINTDVVLTLASKTEYTDFSY